MAGDICGKSILAGSVTKISTMADGSPRLVVDFSCTLAELVEAIGGVGQHVAVAAIAYDSHSHDDGFLSDSHEPASCFRSGRHESVPPMPLEAPLMPILGDLASSECHGSAYGGLAAKNSSGEPAGCAAQHDGRGGHRARQAAAICRNDEFQEFARSWPGISCAAEPSDAAADFVRWACGIKSRAELDRDEAAWENFRKLMRDFREWRELRAKAEERD